MSFVLRRRMGTMFQEACEILFLSPKLAMTSFCPLDSLPRHAGPQVPRSSQRLWNAQNSNWATSHGTSCVSVSSDERMRFFLCATRRSRNSTARRPVCCDCEFCSRIPKICALDCHVHQTIPSYNTGVNLRRQRVDTMHVTFLTKIPDLFGTLQLRRSRILDAPPNATLVCHSTQFN